MRSAADHPRTPRPARPRGFTLVELLVVIAVIAVILGLTVAVIPLVTEQSQVRRTTSILTLLDQAVQEWELAKDRPLSFGIDGDPLPQARYDLQSDTVHVFTISELLAVIGSSPSVESIIAQIDPGHLKRYDSQEPTPSWLRSPGDPDPDAAQAEGQYSNGSWDGTLVVLDAWDQAVRVVHPGWLVSPPDDLDGTIRTGFEDIYGVARNRKLAFVSAGPDGRFGDRSADGDTAQFAATQDNLFSYELDQPEAP